jgi:hypothetical protein
MFFAVPVTGKHVCCISVVIAYTLISDQITSHAFVVTDPPGHGGHHLCVPFRQWGPHQSCGPGSCHVPALRSPWHKLDVVIVLASLVSLVAASLHLTVFRALQLQRFQRMLRMLKLVKWVAAGCLHDSQHGTFNAAQWCGVDSSTHVICCGAPGILYAIPQWKI